MQSIFETPYLQIQLQVKLVFQRPLLNCGESRGLDPPGFSLWVQLLCSIFRKKPEVFARFTTENVIDSIFAAMGGKAVVLSN